MNEMKDETKLRFTDLLGNEEELVQQQVAAVRQALHLRWKLAQGRNDWYGDAALEARERVFNAITEEARDALYWAQFHAARADLCAEQGARYTWGERVRLTPEWVRRVNAELERQVMDDWEPYDTLM